AALDRAERVGDAPHRTAPLAVHRELPAEEAPARIDPELAAPDARHVAQEPLLGRTLGRVEPMREPHAELRLREPLEGLRGRAVALGAEAQDAEPEARRVVFGGAGVCAPARSLDAQRLFVRARHAEDPVAAHDPVSGAEAAAAL